MPPSPLSILDLGELDGPLLLFGGPYSNLEATEALLAAGRALGIPAARTICTGDIVAYGADPEATAEAIRGSGMPVVMGNCEESLARDASECGCGFRRGGGCDLLAGHWYRYAAQNISPRLRAWMGGLPRQIRFTLNGLRVACVHGAPSSINRFVFTSTPEREKLAEIELAGVDGQVEGIVAGHCGIPFTQRLGVGFWHNPGAIGLPANDGTPRVWYSVLSSAGAGRGVEVEHRALDYDFARAGAKMRERGLPEGYANALATGLWPSLDVLPPGELAETGKPLNPGGAVLRFAPETTGYVSSDTPRIVRSALARRAAVS